MEFRIGTRIRLAKNKLKELFLEKDIRTNTPLLIGILIITLGLLGLYLRFRLISYTNGDYTVYISNWYDHLKAHGFSGFKDEFANYNFPYLFLLYLATILPLGKLFAVKLISIIFDIVLTYGVYQIIKYYSKSTTLSILGASAIFFLPTVFINSAYWGQTDAIYTSFILLSFLSLLNGRFQKAWLLFGVAFAFKMQAIFFAPVLVYIWFKGKGQWHDPLIALGTFIVLSIPPVFAGRGIVSCLTVYAHQYGFQPSLSANVPNFYYWLPQNQYSIINGVGVIFAVALTLMLTLVSIMRLKYTSRNLLALTAYMAIVIPYILPQMHDRYFFLFEVITIILAALNPRYVFAIIAMQFVTLNVYMKTLFGSVTMPFNTLAIVTLSLVSVFTYLFIVRLCEKNTQH